MSNPNVFYQRSKSRRRGLLTVKVCNKARERAVDSCIKSLLFLPALPVTGWHFFGLWRHSSSAGNHLNLWIGHVGPVSLNHCNATWDHHQYWLCMKIRRFSHVTVSYFTYDSTVSVVHWNWFVIADTSLLHIKSYSL